MPGGAANAGSADALAGGVCSTMMVIAALRASG
jgi:hypothetical protein